MRLLLVFCSLLCASAVFADRGVISAKTAASKLEAPTFRELHEQYMRVSLNESGWKSTLDQGGILDALKFGIRKRNSVDYRLQLMQRLVRHSPRTFPAKSRFLAMLSPERMLRAVQLKTYNNDWSSTVNLDCMQPMAWNEKKSGTWDGYAKRCVLLRKTTLDFLKGRAKSHCDGKPSTWGSEDDAHRKGGPLDSGWQEISCDYGYAAMTIKGKLVSTCQELRDMARVNTEARRILFNGAGCTLNRFFNWSIIVKKDDAMAMR